MIDPPHSVQEEMSIFLDSFLWIEGQRVHCALLMKGKCTLQSNVIHYRDLICKRFYTELQLMIIFY